MNFASFIQNLSNPLIFLSKIRSNYALYLPHKTQGFPSYLRQQVQKACSYDELRIGSLLIELRMQASHILEESGLNFNPQIGHRMDAFCQMNIRKELQQRQNKKVLDNINVSILHTRIGDFTLISRTVGELDCLIQLSDDLLISFLLFSQPDDFSLQFSNDIVLIQIFVTSQFLDLFLHGFIDHVIFSYLNAKLLVHLCHFSLFNTNHLSKLQNLQRIIYALLLVVLLNHLRQTQFNPQQLLIILLQFTFQLLVFIIQSCINSLSWITACSIHKLLVNCHQGTIRKQLVNYLSRFRQSRKTKYQLLIQILNLQALNSLLYLCEIIEQQCSYFKQWLAFSDESDDILYIGLDGNDGGDLFVHLRVGVLATEQLILLGGDFSLLFSISKMIGQFLMQFGDDFIKIKLQLRCLLHYYK